MTKQADLNSKKNLTLITGGARSGKSELAESMAIDCPHPIYYLATMQRWEGDPECAARIEKHRLRRPQNWKTVEASSRLHETVLAIPPGPTFVIIDCLSLYVSNLLLDGGADVADPYAREKVVSESIQLLLSAISAREDLDFVVVTNEVSWGLVPDTALGRAYRDFLGEANQEFARQASAVVLLVSGLKVQLK